ncbi:glycosyltransferase [Mangrovimicrobium sediminis]|uniref:Glycosyltransferase n=1 Tax=Mangrovimicrobium sediminis TaxID=2562682 RepID=A0A4Z0M359_9GAMM|nr:WecB/TagA/CpsF family glycosyltransferase [Haliea sp. SAOS-164]TGD73969.1 glycosyltransferase [Haliea sp. SAOS-164]
MDESVAQVRYLSRSPGLDIVITPNIDHMVRLSNDTGLLRKIYASAQLCLCDSRILQKLLRLKGKIIPTVVPGSTLTAKLFDDEFSANDRLLIIGGEDSTIATLRGIYCHLNIDHYNPPMGFIRDEREIQAAVDYTVASGASFIFLAVGSPQQELLAQRLRSSEAIDGVALCVGASILFLVGSEKRAPQLMQTLHLEWFYRLIQDPMRLGRRYLGNALGLPRLYLRI